MFKRDQAVTPANSQPGTSTAPMQPGSAVPSAATPLTSADGRPPTERDVVNIGRSIVIKGELRGSADLTVEGQVEGTIDLHQNVLTIGPNGNVKAQVFAKTVIVLGTVTGNITASEKVDIRDGGTVEGDILSPRVGISEGSCFRGSVDMRKPPVGAKSDQPTQPKPTPTPGPVETPSAASPAH